MPHAAAALLLRMLRPLLPLPAFLLLMLAAVTGCR